MPGGYNCFQSIHSRWPRYVRHVEGFLGSIAHHFLPVYHYFHHYVLSLCVACALEGLGVGLHKYESVCSLLLTLIPVGFPVPCHFRAPRSPTYLSYRAWMTKLERHHGIIGYTLSRVRPTIVVVRGRIRGNEYVGIPTEASSLIHP
mgnify:FL=1